MKSQKSTKRHSPVTAEPGLLKSTDPLAPAAAPVKIETPPETDILRMDTFRLTPDHEADLCRRLTARITDRLKPLTSAYQLQRVAQFLEILERDRGCATPAEDFITGLVSSHFQHNGLDLNSIEWHLEEYKTASDGFEDLLSYFGDMYPDLTRKVLASTRAAAPVS